MTARSLSRNGSISRAPPATRSLGPHQVRTFTRNGSATLCLSRHEDRDTWIGPFQTTSQPTSEPKASTNPPYPLTFHVSLDVVHQGPDGAGQVPRVLLDADLDEVPPADRALSFLLELWDNRVA